MRAYLSAAARAAGGLSRRTGEARPSARVRVSRSRVPLKRRQAGYPPPEAVIAEGRWQRRSRVETGPSPRRIKVAGLRRYPPFGAVVALLGAAALPYCRLLVFVGARRLSLLVPMPCGVRTALEISFTTLAEGWVPPFVIPAAECRLMREGEAADACGQGCPRPGYWRGLRRSRRLRSAPRPGYGTGASS